MRNYTFIIIFICLIASCSQNESEKSTTAQPESDASFFPVGNYLLGDIESIKHQGISPKYVHVKNGISDSSFLQLQNIETNLSDFLSPMIDSIGMSSWVKESKFYDESIASFTLSYDVQKDYYEKTVWRKWDVYVDPESQKVDRIFLVKNISDSTIAQLTWIPKLNAKIV
ncbi:MAG: hypothetical protein NT127_05920, partial [Sphingobacteriales bacterium]|nr:hypothetical protein [Sphingobacteriales bacterium]